MRFELTPRTNASVGMRVLASVAAFITAFLIAGLVIWIMGRSPVAAFDVYVLQPLSDPWAIQELIVKATPMALIAIGLSYCFRANLWNIGAEGQYVIGAVLGSWLALKTHGTDAGFWVLPAMLLLGIVGGALYGLIPAFLKTRFGVNEILTSLMLVYVAQLVLDYLVRGPWRDPKGFNFPQSVTFDPAATLPPVFEAGRVHYGAVFAVIAVLVTAVVLGRTLFGYRLKLTGDAPRAARFAGFSSRATTMAVFAISGGLAGLAGISEVAGQIGQLQPSISPGYGFTAITVAFLGRLNPIGILIASLVVALTFIGGESAQILLKLPLDLTQAFQGILLMCVLAADALVSYRIRLTTRGGGK
ncbi:simple sugar transport system permease protein [Microvirga flocculans]|uniref:Simple sugar transport system permease protein n=1 Tax=Microvirga flocculans TaxID=217168 RepID=A0A7W6N8S9_9HYPH|nr:ABC transporter permease [Microvirga flocculans]MBB4041548.1 simple sugar transport system permease protein [Microvirga flocculans]